MAAHANLVILAIGALGLLSILAGLLSRPVGAPLLLVFLGIGMAVGGATPDLVVADEFRSAYTVGTIALVVILFEGGLKTPLTLVRLAIWPALVLATVGVAATAGIVGVALKLVSGTSWIGALLAGSVVAPTDAAAVSALLRRAHVALPERVEAALELESGLNDPASVFLTTLLMRMAVHPEQVTAAAAALAFVTEMAGGAALGVAGGLTLVFLLRRLPLELPLATVFALAGALALFGLAQFLQSSGFLAVYIAAVITGAFRYRARAQIGHFFEGAAWVSQIALFVMLGLLVSPPSLLGVLWPVIPVTLLLILVARPVSVFLCLAPFGFDRREMAFVSWVGLRGAVPIYLCLVPAVADPRGLRLFDGAFVAVIASLLLQGWTIGLAARLLGFAKGRHAAGRQVA